MAERIIGNDKDTALALNRLCREGMKYRLLNDIRADLAVCEIEGWDKREYLLELKELIDRFIVREEKQ